MVHCSSIEQPKPNSEAVYPWHDEDDGQEEGQRIKIGNIFNRR